MTSEWTDSPARAAAKSRAPVASLRALTFSRERSLLPMSRRRMIRLIAGVTAATVVLPRPLRAIGDPPGACGYQGPPAPGGPAEVCTSPLYLGGEDSPCAPQPLTPCGPVIQLNPSTVDVHCCTSGSVCCDVSRDCCLPGQTCGPGGGCCPNESVCGANCCGADQLCLNGKCVYCEDQGEQKCGARSAALRTRYAVWTRRLASPSAHAPPSSAEDSAVPTNEASAVETLERPAIAAVLRRASKTPEGFAASTRSKWTTCVTCGPPRL